MNKIKHAVWFLLLLVVGCSTMPDRSHILNQALIVYEKTLRWGHFDSALSFRSPASTLEEGVPEGYDRIHIGGYNVINMQYSDNGMRFSQWVEIQFVDEESMRSKKIMDKQEWVFDEKANRWFLETPLPPIVER